MGVHQQSNEKNYKFAEIDGMKKIRETIYPDK